MDNAIFKHPDLRLWIVPSLQPASEPAELAASQQIGELIRELRVHFDYIIIDTPPAETVADASVIAKNCDALLCDTAGHCRQKTHNRHNSYIFRRAA